MSIEMKINSRREYELHVKHLLKQTTITNKHKSTMLKIAMEAFDDGLRFRDGKLVIEVKTNG